MGESVTQRLAVVLFNLGGPDSPDAVRPFLRNLFSDPAIIRIPQPFRWLLARLISRRRAPTAQAVYARIGGRSPLLENTRAQAAALAAALKTAMPDTENRVVVAMRYWHPFAAEAAAELKRFQPERIVLLPLYPQYSTTTSASSLTDWAAAASAAGLKAATRTACCYPTEPGFVAAAATEIRKTLSAAPAGMPVRILFSAHGLPQKIVDAGDPYQWQVERSAAAIAEALALPALDSVVCYQSRVGPLKWIGPATEDEIRRAGAEGRAVVLFPIAFVSEHSETLVELDIEYRELAEHAGVPWFGRARTVSLAPEFIDALARIVVATSGSARSVQCAGGQRFCPAGPWACAMADTTA
ncbi:MAG: ferrochelatase [Alphaproteobacteria bacterium]|nr:ferrochelatase [Alphaproteobacteria bacterium]